MCKMAKALFVCFIFTSLAYAEEDEEYYRHEHYGYNSYQGGIERSREYGGREYMPPPGYYSEPPAYYAPPPPPRPRYYGYQQATPQGLLGTVVGGAIGYQMGNGNPLVSGVGAAAGAWLGNELNR